VKEFVACLSALLLSGCTSTIPEVWSTAYDAYPSSAVEQCSSVPYGACRQAVFEYSYEDVYSSTVKALSFSQINVQREEKGFGDIYGSRAAKTKSGLDKFYYRVHIDETEAERCQVTVYSRTQSQGTRISWLWGVVAPSVGMVALVAATMWDAEESQSVPVALAVPVIVSPIVYMVNKEGKEKATVKWSPEDDEELDRIVSFIRTDLLQRD
jgi:hypothetical protein